MASSSVVSFNVFYDPSLAMHLSRGWQLSQLLQGRVATLSANRFTVAIPIDERPEDAQRQKTVEVSQSPTDTLRGMTVAELKKTVIDQYNAKLLAAADKREEGCAVEPIDETLATLSWGSTLMAPEESLISQFGLTSRHEGATLVLETYSSWAARLSALSFAPADPKNKKDVSGIPEDLPTQKADRAALAAETTKTHETHVPGQEAHLGKVDNIATSSASSFTSSDDDSPAEAAPDGTADAARGPVTLSERRVGGRQADRELVRQAMEARLAAQQPK